MGARRERARQAPLHWWSNRVARRPVLVVRAAWTSFLDLLYPPACRICGCDPDPHRDFCLPCLDTIPGRGMSACARCSRRVGPHLHDASGCARCRRETLAVDRVIAAASYDGPVRDLIWRLKFRGERSLGLPLGRWIAQGVASAGVRADLIVPVPLHWRRLIARGYNQAHILAKTTSKELSIPLQPRAVRRVRATTPQSSLEGAATRRQNVRGAFRCRERLRRGATVILVDDVITTGATMGECALALREGGAARIIGAVIAR